MEPRAGHANKTGGGPTQPPKPRPGGAERQRPPPKPKPKLAQQEFLVKGGGQQASDGSAVASRPERFQTTLDGLFMEEGTVDTVRRDGTRTVALSETDSVTVRCSGPYPEWGGADNFPFRGVAQKEKWVGGEWVRYGPKASDRGKPEAKDPIEVPIGVGCEWREVPRLDGWRFTTVRGRTAAMEALCNPKHNCHTAEQLAKQQPRRPRKVRAESDGNLHADSTTLSVWRLR